MNRLIVTLALLTALGVAAVAPAFAQQYPDVSHLKPFSAESNFMSLAGYLRWVVFQQSNNWLSMAEAQRIVADQTKTATP